MRLKEWLKEIEYTLIQGDLDQVVEDVVYDSRKAREHVVFVCMKGSRVDSHDFIPDVVKAGVKVIIVEKVVGYPEGVTVILVRDSREALAKVSAARFGYPAKRMTTIGITGTKGKTTTAHMIKSVLEAAGKKVGMIGTTGITIGDTTVPSLNTTPESYQLQEAFAKMEKAGCEFMIMEVSSQGIKMHRVDGILFDYAIFTNISPDHIGPDEHENFEEYLYYKSQIFSRCQTGIMNADDSYFGEVVKGAKCQLYDFSLSKQAAFKADQLRVVSEPDFVGVEFMVHGNSSMDVRINIPGTFNVYNALAAISVCSLLHIPKTAICHGLAHLKVNGRMEIVHTSDRCTVIVDYAHNAVSMESLLTTLREYGPKRLVCVFGCGGNRSKDRRYSMGEIGARLADLCILTADNSRYEKVEDIMADIRGSIIKTGGNYIEIPDRREAIEYSIQHAKSGDMIAVIGKGHEDYQEINGIRYPFLDRAVVEEAVSKL